MKRTVASAEETQALAAALARGLAEAGLSAVIGLSGELGAGKTTFAQGFVHALPGGEGLYVTSPTFAIANAYETKPPVRHLDLYRLSDLSELEAIGYRDQYFGEGLTLVEWIERVPEAIPEAWVEIHLAVGDADVREIDLRPHGDVFAALLEKVFG